MMPNLTKKAGEAAPKRLYDAETHKKGRRSGNIASTEKKTILPVLTKKWRVREEKKANLPVLKEKERARGEKGIILLVLKGKERVREEKGIILLVLKGKERVREENFARDPWPF